MTTQEAINNIVKYHTLPSQIDFTRPWMIKSIQSEKFIQTLPLIEQDRAWDEINKRMEDCKVWIDPAGGIHHSNEEDPARMYE